MNRLRIPAILTACAVTSVVLAVIGAVRSYSPVPFYDMWNGYLDFFVKASAGDKSVWWAQHNEHRIVLSRLFFWFDLAWFAGRGWFLLAVNYVLAAGSVAVFLAILRERIEVEEARSSFRTAGALSVIALASWTQRENFIGGFQSQFILAQLLPLVAFYLLHRSVRPNAGPRTFAAACVAGLAALGAMANGFFALPLMTIQSLWTRLPWRRTAFLAILSVLGPAIYFHGYETPSDHGSVATTLIAAPGGVAQYVLLYLGGPIYYMTGKGSRLLAEIAGGLLIAAAASFAYRLWRHADRASLPAALLAFLLYIGGSAVGTAGGRLVFGLDQALASRYQTPVLMAWVALFALYAPQMHRYFGWPLLAIPLLLAPVQVQALRSQRGVHFEQKVAALALELGIRDEAQVAKIFPSAQWALELSRIPSERNLSIFGYPGIQDARQRLGEKAKPRTSGFCEGGLTNVDVVKEAPRYFRIEGHLRHPAAGIQPQVLHVVNAAGYIVGYALIDGERFKGYVDSQGIAGSEQYLLEAQAPSCTVEVPEGFRKKT